MTAARARGHRVAAAAWALAALAGCGVGHERRFAGRATVHTFTRDNASAHVIADGRALVMVDSGYERNAGALDAAMREAGLDPADVRAVVITHAHADHAGGARHFQQRYGARVVVGRGDVPMLAAGRNERLCPTGLLGRFRLGTDQGATYAPTRADVVVDGPVSLAPFTGVDARVTPLAGHTSGSLVVTIPGAAFVGDLFRGSLVGDGAATHLYMCDLDDNRADVRRLLVELAPDAELFFTGHFGPVARGAVADYFGL